jgi:hypothetical protein
MTPLEPIGYATPIPGTPDVEHLRLLSIFHYIVGGLIGLIGCFPIIYAVFGLLVVFGKVAQTPAAIGYVLIGFGSVITFIMWTLGACLIFSGRCIARRRNYTFSIVVAALSCLHMPFGTILGIFTLIVLLRPSVKAMYSAAG